MRLLYLVLFVMAAGGLTLHLRGRAGNNDSMPSQKSMSLKEYLETTGEKWFLTGKKKYTIQAMMVSKEMTFHNDLEVVDSVATDDGETVVQKEPETRYGRLLCRRLFQDIRNRMGVNYAERIL